MSPSFNDGDFVLGLKKLFTPAVGQVVVAAHPEFGRIIKRISRVETEQDAVRLSGDNPNEGVSSEAMGLLPRERIIARVIWHIKG